MEKQNLTISIYSENNIGLLNRITTIFTKRHINIESLTVSESEIEDVHRYTVVVNITKENAVKIVAQIEKQVEVIRAYFHAAEDTIFLETALFKISSDVFHENSEIKGIIKTHYANIIAIEKDFFVVEKTGSREETEALYTALKSFGLMQFVRSGRIAITKPKMLISEQLKNFKIKS